MNTSQSERDLDGLSDRQRLVRRKIEAGLADCGLCGDYGAVNEVTGESVPCMACGRDRPKIIRLPGGRS